MADGLRAELGAELGAERARTDQLSDQVDQLSADATTREEFAEQLAPFVLADRLGAKRVLVVAVGADAADVDGVAAMLRVARATVVGPVTITDRFVDPLRAQELLDTALTALPPSVRPGLPATTDGVTASAALLAAVLVRRTPPVTADDRRSVLTAYTDLGYLAGVDPAAPRPTRSWWSAGGDRGGTPALLRAVVEFDRAGPLVVVRWRARRDVTSSGRSGPTRARRRAPPLWTTSARRTAGSWLPGRWPTNWPVRSGTTAPARV